MTWDYLQDKRLDARIMTIAGYLANKIRGKNILDLNCGTGKLITYLPPIYKAYYANDINEKYVEVARKRNPKAEVLVARDDEMPKIFQKEKIDILIIYGYASDVGWDSGKESLTIQDTVLGFVETHKPKYVIIEGSIDYDNNTKNLSRIAGMMEGYKLDHQIYVSPEGKLDYKERRVYMFKKKVT